MNFLYVKHDKSSHWDGFVTFGKEVGIQMTRIWFTCSQCGKTIQIDPEIFTWIYKGYDQCFLVVTNQQVLMLVI